MQKIRLGRTGLMVTKTAMGCLPVQRCNDEAAIELLRAAFVHVLTETKLTEKTVREKFSEIVNAPRIPVGELMTSLIGKLRIGRVYLDDYFMSSSGRSEMIGKFICVLELIKSKIVVVEEEGGDDGVTDMTSHITVSLIGSDDDIKNASLDSYQ